MAFMKNIRKEREMNKTFISPTLLNDMKEMVNKSNDIPATTIDENITISLILTPPT